MTRPAARSCRTSSSRVAVFLAVGALAALAFAPSPADAVEHLDLPVAEAAAGQCPTLTQIKYPWLRCTTNRWGGTRIATATVVANATWESESRDWCGIGELIDAFQCVEDDHQH